MLSHHYAFGKTNVNLRHSMFFTWISRNGKDENLIGNTHACKRLEILQVGFAKGILDAISHSNWFYVILCLAAADAYSHTLGHLDKKLSKYIDGNPVRVDGKPRASGILDTVSNFFFWQPLLSRFHTSSRSGLPQLMASKCPLNLKIRPWWMS